MPINGTKINPRILTDDELREIRDCWGMGVPLRTMASQYGLTELDLRSQLGEPARRTIPEPPPDHRALIGPTQVDQMRERKRQLLALKQMIKEREGRTDG